MWRVVSGALLIVAMVGSVVAAVTVLTQHLGFAPVLSSSMEPAFHPGDLIVTKPEAATDVKVGQVVSLPLPNNPSQRYVHRVVSVSTKDGLPLLRTKGDANPAPESFVLRIDSPQVPVVVTTVPLLGHVSLLLQRPATRILLIIVTLSTIVLAAWRLFDGLWRPGHANHSTRRAA